MKIKCVDIPGYYIMILIGKNKIEISYEHEMKN